MNRKHFESSRYCALHHSLLRQQTSQFNNNTWPSSAFSYFPMLAKLKLLCKVVAFRLYSKLTHRLVVPYLNILSD